MKQTEAKKITVYMPPSEHKRFKQACKESHTTMANKLLHMSIKFSNQKGVKHEED